MFIDKEMEKVRERKVDIKYTYTHTTILGGIRGKTVKVLFAFLYSG